MSTKMLAILGVLVVFFVLLIGCSLGLYGYINSLRTEGISKEMALSAQYVSNQNFLAAYTSGFYEQTGLAKLKSEQMDKILVDAVKGRYSSEGFKPNGAMFSGIMEAYPQLNLEIFDKIVTYVASQREGYKNIQDKLLDMLRVYNTWTDAGIIQSIIIKHVLGCPTTERLVARIGLAEYGGQDALKKMWQIVLTEDTKKAYETGVMAPLSVK